MYLPRGPHSNRRGERRERRRGGREGGRGDSWMDDSHGVI